MPVTSNAPLRAGKGHVCEGGIRVPLIVHAPGIVKTAVTGVPASRQDYFPTILELAGVKPPPERVIDGRSLVPALRQKDAVKREALYWHYPHCSNQGGVPTGAVRQGDFKLIEFYENARLELYNLKDDIGERSNLARRLPKKAAELHGLLKRWRASVNAVMPSPNPNYEAAKAGQRLTGAEVPTAPLPDLRRVVLRYT